jgi:REP element-mobilizing transposase RayT
MRRHVYNLRSQRCFRPIRKAFIAGCNRFGFRLNHYSVQGNHVHLIVEAEDARALARGIQGLAIRIAKKLNRVMNRKGTVFADRYHAHILRTPSEVRRALDYVLFNFHKHAAEWRKSISFQSPDPYSSFIYLRLPATGPPPIEPPKTWLLSVEIRRKIGR